MTYDKNRSVVKKIEEQQKTRLAGDLSKKIIGSMEQSFMGPKTVAWLTDMNEDLAVSGGGEGDSALTSIAILDKLFDEFQRYSFQYNRNEPNKDYIISCKRPEPVSNTDSAAPHFGFIYNNRWATLVVAEPNSVIVSFVAPRLFYRAEDLRNLKGALQFDAVTSQGKTKWKVGDLQLAYSELPTIAKKIFARYIRVTRGECGDLEPLPISAEEPASAQPPVDGDEQQDNAQPSKLDIITDLVMTLIETVDSEISEVEQIGTMAVRSGQKEASGILLERSKGLRRFRQTTADLAKGWVELLGSLHNQS